MKSTKSFFSKAIIYNNMTRFWWSFALAGLILFLTVPLNILNIDVERYIKYGDMVELYRIIEPTAIIISIYAVIAAVLVFRYLQTNKSVTAIHSMPYTRLRLYVNNLISGLVIVLIPLIINLAVMFLIQSFTKYGNIISIETIWKWFLISAMISITLYSIAVMVGMFTGSTIAQILFTYILNFLPVAFVLGINYMLIGLIYGLKEISGIRFNDLAAIMPITQIIRNNWYPINNIIIINSIITVISLIIGFFVYKYRNLESAGEVISNKILKPIFKYGVTTCVMAVGVIYIKLIFEIYNPNIIIYILFALLGYVVAQMLLIKSFKVFKYYKGFLVYVGILIIISLGIKFDILGFEKRIPELAEVDAVVLGYYNDIELLDYDNTSNNMGAQVLKNEANIEKLINVHKDILKNKTLDKYNSFMLAYRLKNGKFIIREYYIDIDKYAEELKDVYDSAEYKIQKYGLFHYNEEELNEVSISNKLESVNISGKEAQNILNLAKERILSDSYEADSQYADVYELGFAFEDKSSASLRYNAINYSTDSYYVVDESSKSYSCITFYVNKNDIELVEYVDKFLNQENFEVVEKIILNGPYKNDEIERAVEINEIVIEDKNEISELLNNRTELLKYVEEKEYYEVSFDMQNGERYYIGCFESDNGKFSKYLD